MSDKSGELTLPPYSVANVLPGSLFASAWLLKSTLRSCSLVSSSAWRWLTWPFASPAAEQEPVDSSKVHFILSGERFPIDLIGSYDVDRAKSIIFKTPRKSVPVSVDVWRAYADRIGWPRLDIPHDSNIDCSVPAIIAVVDKARGEQILIDGWHRIDKASADGKDVIQAFYLTEEETKEIFDPSWQGLPSRNPAV